MRTPGRPQEGRAQIERRKKLTRDISRHYQVASRREYQRHCCWPDLPWACCRSSWAVADPRSQGLVSFIVRDYCLLKLRFRVQMVHSGRESGNWRDVDGIEVVSKSTSWGLQEAVRREVLEESGYETCVDQLLAVEIQAASWYRFAFACTITGMVIVVLCSWCKSYRTTIIIW